jgi:peroxiredoxin
MNLQDRLSQKKKTIEANLPPQYLKIMKKSIKELINSGIQDRVLKVNDQLPDIELVNQNGITVNAKEMYSKAPLVITFYRGFWCTYCNFDLANLNHYRPLIIEKGANMITISPEQAIYSKKIIMMQKLDFDILWDKGNKVADEFGLKFKLSNDMIDLYKQKLHVNLKLYHGDDDWALPMPARFLVDTNGIIRYAESSPDYTKRPELDDLMLALNSL